MKGLEIGTSQERMRRGSNSNMAEEKSSVFCILRLMQ